MVSRHYAPFHHNMDAPDHGRAFRVTDAGANSVDVAAGRVRIDQTVTDFAAPTNIPGLPNGVNYIYIDALGAINNNLGGPYPANSIPLARVTVAAADVTGIVDDRCFFYEDTAAGGGANTLDQAYDQGGAGAGRQINATDGAVLINNPDVDAGIPNLELTRAPADIAAQPILGLRAVGDANFRFMAYGTGQMFWGSGAAGVDVEMLRTAANRLGLAVGDTFEVDTIGSRGGAQVSMEDGVSVPEFLGLPPTLIGIVGGTATPVRSHHILSAEAGVADDLDNLAVGNATDGDVCVIRPDTGDTITIRHAQGGAGQMLCIGNANYVLNDDHDFAICIYNATLNAWMVLSDIAGAGGHVIEDEGVPLAARANLDFVGRMGRAFDNPPDTTVEIRGRIYDAIVDSVEGAVAPGVTDPPVYTTLTQAIADGHVSILIRSDCSAEAPLVIGAGDGVTEIVGSAKSQALLPQITCNKEGVTFRTFKLVDKVMTFGAIKIKAWDFEVEGSGARAGFDINAHACELADGIFDQNPAGANYFVDIGAFDSTALIDLRFRRSSGDWYVHTTYGHRGRMIGCTLGFAPSTIPAPAVGGAYLSDEWSIDGNYVYLGSGIGFSLGNNCQIGAANDIHDIDVGIRLRGTFNTIGPCFVGGHNANLILIDVNGPHNTIIGPTLSGQNAANIIGIDIAAGQTGTRIISPTLIAVNVAWTAGINFGNAVASEAVIVAADFTIIGAGSFVAEIAGQTTATRIHGGYNIEDGGVPLMHMHTLDVVGGPFLEVYNTAADTVIRGGAATYDAIVDSDVAWGGTSIPVYATLQAAITADHKWILFRKSTDGAPITINAEAVERITGYSPAGASVPVDLTCNKADVLIEYLYFTTGLRLTIGGARDVAMACIFVGEGAGLIMSGVRSTSVQCQWNFVYGVNFKCCEVTADGCRIISAIFEQCNATYHIHATGADGQVNACIHKLGLASYCFYSTNIKWNLSGNMFIESGAIYFGNFYCIFAGNYIASSEARMVTIANWCVVSGCLIHVGAEITGVYATWGNNVVTGTSFILSNVLTGIGVEVADKSGMIISSCSFISINWQGVGIDLTAGSDAAKATITGCAFISAGPPVIGNLLPITGATKDTKLQGCVGMADIVPRVMEDDFILTNAFLLDWASGGAGSTVLQNLSGGVVRLQANAGAGIFRTLYKLFSHANVTENPRCLWRVVTNQIVHQEIRAGLSNTGFTAGGEPAEGIYFRRIDGAGVANWFAVCRTGAVETAVDTAIAGTTSEAELDAVVENGGARVCFWVNKERRAIITTNIPAGNLEAGIHVLTQEGVAKNIDLDYWRFEQR